MPKVSVVMPVYNGERFLSKSIESILKQTFADFEFVIINDGSTDSTDKILDKCSQSDNRIVVIHQKNCGVARSLNKGLAIAKGEYIARHDADDMAMPDRFARQVAFLNENPECGLLGTWSYIIDERDNYYRQAEGLHEMRYQTENDTIMAHLLDENHFVHSSVMFRRECIDQVGDYNENIKYAEDYDLWLRISEKYQIANLPEFLQCWRYNETGGVSIRMRGAQLEEANRIAGNFIDKFVSKEDAAKIMGETIKLLKGRLKDKDQQIEQDQERFRVKDQEIYSLGEYIKELEAFKDKIESNRYYKLYNRFRHI